MMANPRRSITTALLLTLSIILLSHTTPSHAKKTKPPAGNGKQPFKQPKSMSVGDLSISIAHKSGRISIRRSKMGKKKSKQSRVDISMHALREIDASGNVVESHSVSSFGQKDFTFEMDRYNVTLDTPDTEPAIEMTEEDVDTASNNSTNTVEVEVDSSPLTNRTLSNTNNSSNTIEVTGTNTTDGTTDTSDTELEEIATPPPITAEGTQVTFHTTLDTGSQVSMQAILISGKGQVGTATEHWSVLPGDMKFNIELSNWDWADDSTDNSEGTAAVELDIEIHGSKAKPEPMYHKRARNGEVSVSGPRDGSHDNVSLPNNRTWELGEGAILELSDQVLLDGETWSTMPEGYPRVVVQQEEGKQLYTFRFDKFHSTAYYDPVVEFDESYDDSAAAGANSRMSVGVVATFWMTMLFSMIFL